MAGLSREQYEQATKEILASWHQARTRDEGLRVIVDFGQKYGYKNVMAAIQGKTPKRFDRETSIDDWVAERNLKGE